jgi:hypothetical protein
MWFAFIPFGLGLGDFALKRDTLWVQFDVVHNGKNKHCVLDEFLKIIGSALD